MEILVRSAAKKIFIHAKICLLIMLQGYFVPLADYQNPDDVAMGDFVAPQPRETPGDPGSSIPGIEAFRDPSMSPELARVFRSVHFDYNSNLVKGDDNLMILRDVTRYMQTHPNTYIFVEGHCDERGPEAFNLALGARRSNADPESTDYRWN